MMLNVRVRSANGTDHNKTLYLPLFKPEQNTKPSTKDLIELDYLIWGIKQAMLAQRIHWNVESLEIESRALIEFVKDRQGIKAHTVDLVLMNQSAEAGEEPLMLRTMPIGILEIKSQVQTLRAHGIIADEIPSWIGELTQLENLKLDGSTHDSAENHNSVLTQLPISMGDIERLNTIALSNFIRLRELPETLGSLSSLQKLDVRGCDTLATLPVCLDQWTGMECLMLNDMPSFTELPPNMRFRKFPNQLEYSPTSNNSSRGVVRSWTYHHQLRLFPQLMVVGFRTRHHSEPHTSTPQ